MCKQKLKLFYPVLLTALAEGLLEDGEHVHKEPGKILIYVF